MKRTEVLSLNEKTEVYVKGDSWNYKYYFTIRKVKSVNYKDGFSYYGTATEHFSDGTRIGQFNIDKITDDKIYLFTSFLGCLTRLTVDINTLTTEKI